MHKAADPFFLSFVKKGKKVAYAASFGKTKFDDATVDAYKKMLSATGVAKLIWVTEAESFNGKTAEENYELTKKSTEGAIAAGAEKIFFTRFNFNDFRTDMSQMNVETEESIIDSQKKYQNIISQF